MAVLVPEYRPSSYAHVSLWLSVLLTSAQMLQLQFKGIADTKWKVTTIGFEFVP
jgi:hypothetical protein